MLLVVRHADAGDKRSWTGPDRLRPLSATGCRQAEGLVIRLEDYPVNRVLSGPTLRCQQTVQPLARDRFLEIEPLAALGVDAAPTQLRALFLDLVVEDPLGWPKGSTWLLERTDRGQVYGRLLGPLALEGLQLAEP
jgi:hypothetical protein